MPVRIQLSRRKGWRKSPDAIVVARPSVWGNPFRAAEPADRPKAVAQYRAWLSLPGQTTFRREAKALLAGRNLACWCPLGTPCHADVLLEFVNR